MDSILADSSLPRKYVAFSHCFRTEAGAAGTATRYSRLLFIFLPFSYVLYLFSFTFLAIFNIPFFSEAVIFNALE